MFCGKGREGKGKEENGERRGGPLATCGFFVHEGEELPGLGSGGREVEVGWLGRV